MSSPSRIPTLVLDFDGVLAIPWTNPVELYAQIPELLKALSSAYTLALASFNPTAISELRRHGVLDYFKATRAGTHEDMEIKEFVADLGTLCKAQQIQSIGKQLQCEDFHFFDDDFDNIEAVNKLLPKVHTSFVDSKTGLTLKTVEQAIDRASSGLHKCTYVSVRSYDGSKASFCVVCGCRSTSLCEVKPE
jgi:hypothetical protein